MEHRGVQPGRYEPVRAQNLWAGLRRRHRQGLRLTGGVLQHPLRTRGQRTGRGGAAPTHYADLERHFRATCRRRFAARGHRGSKTLGRGADALLTPREESRLEAW